MEELGESVVRDFTSFSQAADEAALSRLYGGIHWRYDNEDGLTAGRALGELVYSNFLRKIGDLNHDDCVSPVDLVILLAQMGQTNSPADLNGDGIVNNRDRGILIRNLESLFGC